MSSLNFHKQTDNDIVGSSYLMYPNEFTHKLSSSQSSESNLSSYNLLGSTYTLSRSYHSEATQITLVNNDHPMLTCTQVGHYKSKFFFTHIEPRSMKQTLSQVHWFEVMKDKYDSLMHNGTWELTTLPPN